MREKGSTIRGQFSNAALQRRNLDRSSLIKEDKGKIIEPATRC